MFTHSPTAQQHLLVASLIRSFLSLPNCYILAIVGWRNNNKKIDESIDNAYPCGCEISIASCGGIQRWPCKLGHRGGGVVGLRAGIIPAMEAQKDGENSPTGAPRMPQPKRPGSRGARGCRADVPEPPVDLKALHAKIRQLALENNFFRQGVRQRRPAERKAMIDRGHELPMARRASLLGISRSSVCYAPRAVGEAHLALMHRIDDLHLERSFSGARVLTRIPRREGFIVGRKHVGTLMKHIGIEALFRKPNTRRRRAAHKI
jgi:hypothetical protein